MESVEFVQWCLDNMNYWVVLLLMTIESSFIPFPSEIVIPPAAYMAAETGEMNVVVLIVVATLGSALGALVNYVLSYYVGRPIVYKFANSRLGHLCLLDEGKVMAAEKYFDEHGVVSTFVGRLIPAIRQLISIPAGLAKMNIGKFLLYTSLGAGVWNTVLALAGYYMQSLFPKDVMMSKIEEYSSEFKIVCFSIIGIILVYLAFRFFSNTKKL